MEDVYKLKISRRNDFIDYFSMYKLIINDKTYKIKSGETKSFKLNEGINTIIVQFLYFKKKVEIHSNSSKYLLISSFLNRNWFLFFLSLFVITFILMSFTKYNFNTWYTFVSYIGIAFISIIFYHCTIGRKNYLSIDFKE